MIALVALHVSFSQVVVQTVFCKPKTGVERKLLFINKESQKVIETAPLVRADRNMFLHISRHIHKHTRLLCASTR